jgi:hypothetical protein
MTHENEVFKFFGGLIPPVATKIVRVPRRFYDDCVDCGTRTPPVVKKTKRHYWVDLSKADPDYDGPDGGDTTAENTLSDFTSRADLYADAANYDNEYRYLQQSAKATLAALTAA